MALESYREQMPRLGRDVYIHPSATVIGDVELGDETSVWPNVVIRGDVNRIRVGARSNIQDGSILHVSHRRASDPEGSPLFIGRAVSIGHGVILHGCTIGDYTMVGMGSVVMNKSVIGRESLVGAGALIPEGKSFPDRVLILGSPARVVRDLTDDEIAILHGSAAGYVAKGRRYASECQPI